MKKLISIIILIAFISLQGTAYAQGLAYPANTSDVTTPKKRIVMKRLSPSEKEHNKEKDEAIIDAMFEAGYKTRQERRDNTIRGAREKAIIKRYELAKAKNKGVDLRKNELIEKKGQRKIEVKRDIPRGIDLGSGAVRKINEAMYPLKMSGEYQASWGYDAGRSGGKRSIWKDADFNRGNLVYVLDNSYVFGEDRVNTYDKRVFDRFRLKLESVEETGYNFLSEIVVDPWSFVGKTDPIVITGRQGQQLPLQLRYWSNTQSTIDERIWMASGQDFVNVPEIKVHDGSTLPQSVQSRWTNTIFDIPRMDINRDFRPLRKLEMGYRSDNLDIKVFPLADQDHAYTSDDPLVLSNKHIYWEPSPWLNHWEPALYFPNTDDYRRGSWRNYIPFEARDSDFNYLTLLRGLSFEVTKGNTYLAGSAATPLNPWQQYVKVNSLPAAFRLKQNMLDDYYLGTTYTTNYGFDEGRMDAFNHALGIDAGFEKGDAFSFRAEYARSIDKIDIDGHEPGIDDFERLGQAFKVEAKGNFFKDWEEPMIAVTGSYAYMSNDFVSRLSNYRNTRSDEFWGKHIMFQPVKEDFLANKIGDGLDIGRNVIAFRMENNLLRGDLMNLFDMRFVKGDFGGKVERVYREELTYNFLSNLVGKFLFRYQDMPETTAGLDPFIITDDISIDNTDQFVQNDDILGGENPDVWTVSWGFHYDPVRWFGLEGIYEKTNDYETFPSRVFNDAGFLDLGDMRRLNYFLYSQPLIARPPYDDYNIYKARIFLSPLESLRAKLEYVVNTNKKATGRDDNISHWGIELDADLTEKLRGSFKFIRSQVIDLFAQMDRREDVPFNTHNNIFAELEYIVDDNNSLSLQFGEFYVPEEFTPVPWILNTLDTQRIVRLYLKGRF